MEIAVKGWGRDHGEKVIVKRDLATAEIGSFNSPSRQTTYITAKSPSAEMNLPSIEIRFDSKIVLNGDYLVRVALTKREITSLFFLLNSDTSLDDLVDEFVRVRRLHDNGPLPALPPLPFAEIMLKTVDDCEFSVRTSNCLKNEKIVYVGDLVQKTEREMLLVFGGGRRSLIEIKDALSKMNLQLGMIVQGWRPQNVDDLAKKFRELNKE